ncbi:hypothetical protein [Paenibacillus sp. FSL W7-1287]|uniref:hypothetical protein n=1 Tax=Paenibacillus sp. FSL W7-1287 TaxID=2954538 RepID=UPI0030F98157
MYIRSIFTVISFSLAVVFLSACDNTLQIESKKPQNSTYAQVTKVYTNLIEKSGWWVVPKDIHKLTIYVEANNTETVLFWLIPTGTKTWDDRELIGYDINESDGWSLEWDFGERTFHDHIYVQVLGNDSFSMDSATINVTSTE